MHPLISKYPELQHIIKAERHELFLKMIVGMVSLIGGVWVMYRYGFQGISWLIPAFSLLMIVTGIRLVLDSIKYQKIQAMPIFKDLLFEPENIVWVYTLVTQRMPFGIEILKSGSLHLKTINGEEHQVRLDEKYLPILTQCLREMIPHATFGFTKEREQWYMANPALLLNDD